MGKLPFELPYISTIPEHSNIMAIIGHNSVNWLWFLNYFIQLRINKDTRSKLCLNFCYGDNYKLVKDMPFLETHSMPRKLLNTYDGFTSFVKRAVDMEYYVYVSIDRYEISSYEEYHKKHKNHDILIYGYDETGYDIADFFKENYEASRCSAKELDQGYGGFDSGRDNFGFEEVILLKEDKGYKHVMYLPMVRTLVNEYMKGVNSDIHFMPIRNTDFLKDTQAYGIKIYGPMREYFMSHEGKEAQIVSMHMLYEHKRMMFALLDYLSDNNYLLHCDENMRQIKEIKNTALILRNLYLKYMITCKSEIMWSVVEKLNELEQKERGLFAALASDICDVPQNQAHDNIRSQGTSKHIKRKGSSLYYLFRGNEFRAYFKIKGESDKKVVVICDGDRVACCAEAEDESIILSNLEYGYHYIVLENCTNERIGVEYLECRTLGEQVMRNQCIFEEADTRTKGKWMACYGREGYEIYGWKDTLPVYIQLVYGGFEDKKWKMPDKHNRGQALCCEDGKEIAACKYFRESAFVDIIAAGKEPSIVSFYIMDCYYFQRHMEIGAYDADTQELLEAREVQVIEDGVYFSYRIKGHIVFRFRNLGREFGCVSGVFIDKGKAESNCIKKETMVVSNGI